MRTARVALALLVLTGWISAGVIFSEDFEGQSPAEVVTGLIGTTAFEVIAGNVDLVAPPNPYTALCGTGNSCIDTTGSGGRGTISTINPIHFAPGLYYLSFRLQGWSYPDPEIGTINESATIRVILPGLLDTAFFVAGASNPYPLVRIVFSVETEQNLKLTFQDLSGSAGYAGAILDDIEIGTAVPEPASFLLMLPGLAGLLWARKRLAARTRC
jgi:hypothetical protein